MPIKGVGTFAVRPTNPKVGDEYTATDTSQKFTAFADGVWTEDPRTVSCRVKRTAAQTISDTTFTTINWDAEDYDTAAMHDNATNNSRMTAPTAGKYLLTVVISFDTSGVGFRKLAYTINGGANIMLKTDKVQGTVPQRTHGSTVENLAANDFIEIRVDQNSGGDLDVQSAQSHATLTRLGD